MRSCSPFKGLIYGAQKNCICAYVSKINIDKAQRKMYSKQRRRYNVPKRSDIGLLDRFVYTSEREVVLFFVCLCPIRRNTKDWCVIRRPVCMSVILYVCPVFAPNLLTASRAKFKFVVHITL